MLKEPVIKMNDKGERFVLFFRPYEKNGVCSNWYMSDFTDKHGIKFNCTEQYMMYEKAKLFKDDRVAQEILGETNPKEMKAYGRKVKNYDDKLWSCHRYGVLIQGLYYKFTQNQELNEWIKKADCDYFVECSPYDRIWGIKTDIESDDCIHIEKWNGENLLGKCLGDVRGIIMAGINHSDKN